MIRKKGHAALEEFLRRNDVTLAGLERELESILGIDRSDDPVRTKLAIARGYFDLTRRHGDRLRLERVVPLMEESARILLEGAALEEFLRRIRAAPDLLFVHPAPAAAPVVDVQNLPDPPPRKPWKNPNPKIRKLTPGLTRFEGRIVSRRWVREHARH